MQILDGQLTDKFHEVQQRVDTKAKAVKEAKRRAESLRDEAKELLRDAQNKLQRLAGAFWLTHWLTTARVQCVTTPLLCSPQSWSGTMRRTRGGWRGKLVSWTAWRTRWRPSSTTSTNRSRSTTRASNPHRVRRQRCKAPLRIFTTSGGCIVFANCLSVGLFNMVSVMFECLSPRLNVVRLPDTTYYFYIVVLMCLMLWLVFSFGRVYFGCVWTQTYKISF